MIRDMISDERKNEKIYIKSLFKHLLCKTNSSEHFNKRLKN